MLRTISNLRSSLTSGICLPQALRHFSQFSISLLPTQTQSIHLLVNPSPSTQSSLFHSLSSPCSSLLLQKHQDGSGDDFNTDPKSPPRLFVVQPRFRPDSVLKPKLNEALNLANSLEEQRHGFYDTEFLDKQMPHHLVVQNPASRSIRADTFFGPGTVDTVKCHVNSLDTQEGIDAIFVNAILTGIQQRNLERAWGKPVLDRVGLIIEIFNAHAQTKEAKLQAELAALMYKKSRLVRVRGPGGRYGFGVGGEAEVVSARGRGSGGRGFISGAGETELQLQRRRILERRNQLLSEIKEVRRTRALQRAARKRHGGSDGQEIPTVAVVGYTNAGKSTLVSAVSESFLYCDDRLFATVDPKLRSVVLPSGRKVLLSDTVGFISELPIQLVEAFHATLEEVVEADLLVHVLDSSAPNLNEQREAVLQVLGQIGVSEQKLQNMIEVWNKIDLREDFVGDGYCNEDEVPSGLEENNDVASNKLCEEDLLEYDDNEDEDFEQSGKLGEVIDDQQGNYTDELVSGDEQESWVDYNGSLVGCGSAEVQQNDPSNKWEVVGSENQFGSESAPHVKTSALTGVGLQELLELLDEKLKPQKTIEKDIFDRKWRPPRTEDARIAVEQ
ncbi:GTP-binding protein At3g49725, chloroplastic isoform X2 [Solanum lycopersicum]|uniref:GTP-binding protein At3g49725, chloroplastic isoform X2 n=1 Tax=Solanum lycopersicum TaxID=4081 RepID=UPI0002767D56|nr:GTP-binding protein At3g49725, chloroplastic isoform X2 [Solanum lycopersicum]